MVDISYQIKMLQKSFKERLMEIVEVIILGMGMLGAVTLGVGILET